MPRAEKNSKRGSDLASLFKLHRFVTSEHITAPTGLAVSPQGVVFVSCDPNGTTNERRGAGKVVRCEDTDGDSQADKFSNFVEGIDSPRGSCYVDDTLYLVQSPFLVAYQDPNGDGVAEEKSVLVTQLGQGLTSTGVVHGPNGVRMGIDGWLYLAIGDQGCFKATGTDGSQATLHGGGVLRARPDGSQLSALVTGTRNVYDVAVDPQLDLFARDNTNDGGGWGTRLHHLTELADFGYPDRFRNFGHEHMQSLADYGSGAGTGMYYLHEPGFPEDFGDALYSGDFNTGLWIHPRKPHGASYQVQQRRFVDSPMNTDIDVDGLTRMYCASWQGGGFGSASEPFGHVDLIQPKDRTRAAFPDLSRASDEDLLTHLTSPSQVARLNAMREVVTRGPRRTFTTRLLEIAKNTATPLFGRVAAVMTLKQLNGAKSHAPLSELYPDPELREFVVRALGDVASEIDELSKKLCLRALKDENPRVQLRAIVALSRTRDVNAATAILPLAKDERMLGERGDLATNSKDWSPPHRVIPHTALQAIVKLNAVDLLLGQLDGRELHEVALRGLQEIHSDKVVTGLAAKVATTNDKKLAKWIALALFRLYHREASWNGTTWWRSRPNFTGPYVESAKWEHTAVVKTAIEAAFRKVDKSDYADLFNRMRLNQVPEEELDLDIQFDEALALLKKEKTLTSEEYNFVMAAAVDSSRPEKELLEFYRYFQRGPLPESYFNRIVILSQWGEGRAKGKYQRQAYAEFVSGKEFIGKVKELGQFLGNSERYSYKYAHIQLIHLINDASTPRETRQAAEAELEKTWKERAKIYPHRLRGLMLAFEEVDPTPYAKQLKPLVDHRDERTKQGAARYLQRISKAQKKKAR
ncbi:MAG: HEAT repeat domain-containing protein [Planctomycetota bacterium]